jgi:hypothetical protein
VKSLWINGNDIRVKKKRPVRKVLRSLAKSSILACVILLVNIPASQPCQVIAVYNVPITVTKFCVTWVKIQIWKLCANFISMD